MPYVTVNVEPRTYQLTFDDILNGCSESDFMPAKDTRDTRTWLTNNINPNLIEKTNFRGMYEALASFNEKYAGLINTEDKSVLYRSFKIPKRSGGLRKIDAPQDDLMKALRELKEILEKKFYASYHTTAFAYVAGRSTIDSVKRHQTNNSRWFLKLDAKGFFPSTTEKFLIDMLCELYPFCVFVNYDYGYREALQKALSLCFLNGGLPQGTPTSPMLTNMMMIPIDHAIAKMCREYSPHLCYTRYADDMLISSQFSFHWTDVQNKITDIFNQFSAPFTLNAEKTRYGSSAGRNWNLGVMLNKENKITIGHEKKKVFKAMIFQFMTDDAKGVAWELEDVQHFLGLVAYYKMVEGEEIDKIINAYSAKFNKDVLATAKALLNP